MTSALSTPLCSSDPALAADKKQPDIRRSGPLKWLAADPGTAAVRIPVTPKVVAPLTVVHTAGREEAAPPARVDDPHTEGSAALESLPAAVSDCMPATGDAAEPPGAACQVRGRVTCCVADWTDIAECLLLHTCVLALAATAVDRSGMPAAAGAAGCNRSGTPAAADAGD